MQRWIKSFFDTHNLCNQGLDGEATEPMIKELEDDREESQDPEVEFAIAGVMRECNGLDLVLNMVQVTTTYLFFFV